jgi:hypothetical protein
VANVIVKNIGSDQVEWVQFGSYSSFGFTVEQLSSVTRLKPLLDGMVREHVA